MRKRNDLDGTVTRVGFDPIITGGEEAGSSVVAAGLVDTAVVTMTFINILALMTKITFSCIFTSQLQLLQRLDYERRLTVHAVDEARRRRG